MNWCNEEKAGAKIRKVKQSFKYSKSLTISRMK